MCCLKTTSDNGAGVRGAPGPGRGRAARARRRAAAQAAQRRSGEGGLSAGEQPLALTQPCQTLQTACRAQEAQMAEALFARSPALMQRNLHATQLHVSCCHIVEYAI